MSRWIREMENERKRREGMLRTITGEPEPIPATSYQAYRQQHGLVGGTLRYWFRRHEDSSLANYQDKHGLVKGTLLRGREYWGQRRQKAQKPVEITGTLDLSLHDEDLDAYRARVRELVDGEVSTDAVAAAEQLTQRLPEGWTEGYLLTAYASIRLFDATANQVYLDKARESVDRAWYRTGEGEREGIAVHRDYIYQRAEEQGRNSRLDQLRQETNQIVNSEVSDRAVDAAERLIHELPSDWTEGYLLAAFASIRMFDQTLKPHYLRNAKARIEHAWVRARPEEVEGIGVHREYILRRGRELEAGDSEDGTLA